MKNKLCMAFIAMSMIATSLPGMYAQTGEPSVSIISEGLRFTESTCPYGEGILIANFGTEQLNPLNTEGKGYIVYRKDGKNMILVPADGHLSAPKGMFVRGGYLFVCDVNKIVVYNLRAAGEEPRVIRLPEGNLFVNDLVASGNDLYVSVTNTDKIYRIDITSLKKIGEPAEWLDIPGPNGLAIGHGGMYVASYPADGNVTDEHVIYRVADLKNPRPEKYIATPGLYDGIAFSTDKKSLYITNWSPAQISKIDMKTKQVVPLVLPLEKALVGPADISVKDGYIYIPDLPNSRVVKVKE